MNLRTVLFVCFTLVSVVPVVFLGAWVHGSALDNEITAVEEKHLLMARNLTSGLTRYVTDVEAAFRLAAVEVAAGGENPDVAQLLDAIHMRELAVVDPSGEVVRSLLTGGADATAVLSFPMREAARHGASDSVRFSDVMADANGEPVVVVSQRLGDGAVAAGALRTDYIVELQRLIAFGTNGHAAIVDSSGRVLAHPKESWVKAMKDISVVSPVQRMMRGESGISFFYSPAVKAEMVAGFTTVPAVGWGVMVPQPMAELEQRAGEVIMVAFGLAMMGVATAALASWWLAGFIAGPILAVSQAALSVSRGQLEQPQSARSIASSRAAPNEVKSLGASTTAMLNRLREARIAQRDVEERLRDFAEASTDWFWEMGPDLRYTYRSERYFALTGFSPEGPSDAEHVFAQAHGGVSTQAWARHVADLKQRKPFKNVEYGIRTAFGARLQVRMSGTPVFDEDGQFTGYRGTGTDISEAHQLSQELAHQAHHDVLTGLVNRRGFEDRLAQVLATNLSARGEHAVCYMDLDQFKVVNDTCGHVAGDALLRRLSDVIAGCVRRQDTLARLGGDEFGLIMEHCSTSQARRVADKIREAIAEFRFMWSGRVFRFGVSIGLVPVRDSHTDCATLLSLADTACYAAKDAGRNRVHVYRPDDTEVAVRQGEMQWVGKLEDALDNERLDLWFQPIVPVAKSTNESSKVELLLRLDEGEGPLVHPGAFLPAAERFGLAPRLDRWVLERAIDWLAESELVLSRIEQCFINLSGASLGDEDFCRFAVDRLREAGPAVAGRICFEVTETTAIANLVRASAFMGSLKLLGCQFALDDFGAGLSSFAYLRSLPVDYLKIDGVFVRDIVDDEVDRALVQSISDIGHVMGKRTIAEFVENEAILGVLKDLGVDYAQGYGVARPAPCAPERRRHLSLVS